ncbi:cation diffusion facilitator family transporter [Aliarcobacter cibarius]|uniref:Cation transporter n=1 Tax=Aliarcobacter cibarius TaxID=255507 RepID=A0A7L5JPU7_9BACT|nr:cation diffusion facilitator family transporter [Aliarcobacter cibarius]QKJ26998.1 divalent metal cation transporter (ZT_dimer domain) [Aliarcobacter cibarius]TLS98502.1 cation transporter [Aliarcobacter cibarius]TLS99188.1 cation transporter [Aliarcobacter cibarius]
MSPQKKATVVSSTVAAILTIIKLAVGLFSGSVAVLASAIDSILDMFVSIFNYFAISKSEKPADKTFNYGKGKIEALASVIEGTIISMSGLFLLYQAFSKYKNGEVSSYLEISIYVMISSLVITIGLVLYLNYIAKKTHSMVIKADALHYKTDVFSSIAVLLSLLLVSLTGYELFDVIIGSLIALYIIYSAYNLIHSGIMVLLDRALDEEMVINIISIFMSHKDVHSFHHLKTREAANKIFVEAHLVFSDTSISLVKAHKISDLIEDEIEKLNDKKEWHITIHLDPYDDSKVQNE